MTAGSQSTVPRVKAAGRFCAPRWHCLSAADACNEAERYLRAGVPVGIHLADQLLIPMALGGGGSFRTLQPTAHTLTNAEVIRKFLAVPIRLEQEAADVFRATVGAGHHKERP